MSIVRSTHTNGAIPNNGTLPAANWSGAGVLPVPGGTLMVKNDANHLYIGLDVTGDTGNDPGTNDYYWLVIDVDGNGAVTPNRDALFSPWPGDPNRLGMWLMAAPDATWPAANTQIIASQTHEGFGGSLNSAVSHRMWTIVLKLSDIGITIDPSGPAPTVKFGLRLASATPGFTDESPVAPLADFLDFNEIILATTPDPGYPVGTAGIVIGGVGLVPATLIGADGYATITDPYFLNPNGAAFTGTLNLIYNTATIPGLYAAGAQKYVVRHRSGNTIAALGAASWQPIRQSWANYLWNGSTYVWETFGPDAANMYPLSDPTLDYSIKALLFQWDTSVEPNNLHEFEVQFFNAGNGIVASPAQTMTLRLDNEAPAVHLADILHGGSSVPACAIVNLSGPTDGVQLVYTAFDPEGDLDSWSLSAEYGAGVTTTIASDSYAPGHASAAHNWQGVTNQTSALWRPPYTCAYLFRVSATKRVTNGYAYPTGYYSDFKTVTLIMPGLSLKLKPLPLKEMLMPYGVKGPAAGVGPATL